MILAVTGGIASGKSKVTTYLKELGAQVQDADQIARALSQPGAQGYEPLFLAFGPSYFLPNGALDRKKLASLIFADESARAQLNRILHPLVIRELHEATRRLTPNPVVWDVPLLYEIGLNQEVDLTWVVWLDQATQIERLRQRNPNLSLTEIEARMGAQMPLDSKKAKADVVIYNNGSWLSTQRQVDHHWREFLAKAQKT